MALKWRLCGLLFLATTLNYLDRQTLSILAPTLQRDLHMDNAALGWLFAAFYYAYTFAQVAVGPILDRVRLRWAFGAAVLVWSIVSAMTGLVTSFTELLVFRLLLGIAEAANWPGATRITAGALEPRERALGNGLFTSGTSIGALIAPALIFAIATQLNWRWAFVLIGLLGVMWFALWAFSTRDPKLESVWRYEVEEKPVQEKPAKASLWRDVSEIVSSTRFVPVLIVAVLVNPCLYFSVNWLPTYFAQQRGLTPGAQLGWILTAIYLGLGVGNFLCGTVVLVLTRQGHSLAAAQRTVFLAATVPLAACAIVPFVGLGPAVLILIAVNIGLGVWTAIYLTMVQDVAPARVSTSLGILSGCGSLAGALAMWAVGKVTHETGSFLIPLVALAVAGAISAMAGCVANRERPVLQVAHDQIA